MANEVAVKQKTGIATYLSNDKVKNQIVNLIGEKATPTFISSIVSAVQTNPTLAECTNPSILSAAMLGESLKLSPSPQLGMYYIVPFNNTKYVENPSTGRKEKVQIKEAQFQLGYKGYIQLAIRSGQYKKIVVSEIKDGEMVCNPITEEFIITPISNPKERAKAETVGYYGRFELINGFIKEIYWSKEEMCQHAETYSSSYKSDKKYGNSKSYWSINFDSMSKKTLIRQLLSKYGVMSVEMQNAYEKDMSVIREDGTADYVDNKQEDIVDVVAEEIQENANTVEFDENVIDAEVTE